MQRVICFQLAGFINHQRQNNTNFNALDADGKPFNFKSHIGKWADHDPERYAYANYGKVLEHLVEGTPFESTNIPPGYHYKPWTIQELLEAVESGETLDFDGDWS